MSNFKCEKCGTVIEDSPNGYITGCEHYPIEKKDIVKSLNGFIGQYPFSPTAQIAIEEIQYLRKVENAALNMHTAWNEFDGVNEPYIEKLQAKCVELEDKLKLESERNKSFENVRQLLYTEIKNIRCGKDIPTLYGEPLGFYLDLKAKCAKYEQTLKEIAELQHYDKKGQIQDSIVDAILLAKQALENGGEDEKRM